MENFKLRIPNEALIKAKMLWQWNESNDAKNHEIQQLKAQVADFWEFLIEQDLVDEFYEWENR